MSRKSNRWTEEELANFMAGKKGFLIEPPKKKPRVRGANRTVVDGINFPSEKEAKRYCDLKILERAGQIKNLKRQVTFPLVVKGHPIFPHGYIADFTYFEKDGEAWRYVVEDAKGFRTETYETKKQLMFAIYGVIIRET